VFNNVSTAEERVTPQHEISVDPEREGGIAISIPTMPKADCLVAGRFMVYHSEKRSE